METEQTTSGALRERRGGGAGAVGAASFTREHVHVQLLVAVVCGAAHGVDARVVLDRGGADKRTIQRDQLLLVNALASLDGRAASRLTDGDVTDAIGDAAGVGTAAVAVTLEGCRKSRRRRVKATQPVRLRL